MFCLWLAPQYDVRHLGFQDGRHEKPRFLKISGGKADMDKIPKKLFSNVYQLSAILKIQDGRHSGCTIADIFSIKTNRNILFVDNPPFSGSRNHINPA